MGSISCILFQLQPVNPKFCNQTNSKQTSKKGGIEDTETSNMLFIFWLSHISVSFSSPHLDISHHPYTVHCILKKYVSLHTWGGLKPPKIGIQDIIKLINALLRGCLIFLIMTLSFQWSDRNTYRRFNFLLCMRKMEAATAELHSLVLILYAFFKAKIPLIKLRAFRSEGVCILK